MHTFLQYYSVFILIKEFVVLISILMCFFSHDYDDIRREKWQRSQQFVCTLFNFYFGLIHPCCIYSLFHQTYYNRLKYIDHDGYNVKCTLNVNLSPKIKIFVSYETI